MGVLGIKQGIKNAKIQCFALKNIKLSQRWVFNEIPGYLRKLLTFNEEWKFVSLSVSLIFNRTSVKRKT